MKRLLIVALAATLLLSACNTRTPENSSSSQESASEESFPEDSEPSEESSTPEEAPFEENDAFFEQVMLCYGAELEDGVLRTAPVSLYYTDDWEQAEQLSAGSFYSWRLCQMWNEDITYEEQLEKYESPLGPDNGWFFAQDEYEALVQQYFDVSVEYLRSDTDIYNAELRGYTLQGGGGMGERPALTLQEVEKDGDLRLLHISIPYTSEPPQVKLLTIRLGSDSTYQFVSCSTEVTA